MSNKYSTENTHLIETLCSLKLLETNISILVVRRFLYQPLKYGAENAVQFSRYSRLVQNKSCVPIFPLVWPWIIVCFLSSVSHLTQLWVCFSFLNLKAQNQMTLMTHSLQCPCVAHFYSGNQLLKIKQEVATKHPPVYHTV